VSPNSHASSTHNSSASDIANAKGRPGHVTLSAPSTTPIIAHTYM